MELMQILSKCKQLEVKSLNMLKDSKEYNQCKMVRSEKVELSETMYISSKKDNSSDKAV